MTEEFIFLNARNINKIKYLEKEKEKIKSISVIDLDFIDSNNERVSITFPLDDENKNTIVNSIKNLLLSSVEIEIDFCKKILIDNGIELSE